jgi:nucleoside-diphosphate-sugar epimerase
VNIGSGTLVTFRELAAKLVELEGYEAAVEGTEDKPVGVAQRYCDPTRMRALLGWEPTISLEQGLERVLVGARKRLAAGLAPVG